MQTRIQKAIDLISELRNKLKLPQSKIMRKKLNHGISIAFQVKEFQVKEV